MISSTTFLTTVAAPGFSPYPFEQKLSAIKLYFHVVLRTDGADFVEEQKMRFKQYIAGFVRTTGNSVKAVNFAQGKVYLLVGLDHTRSLGDFVRDLKLVSKTFAQKKLGAGGFGWLDQYEAFTISLSQIERVRSYIGRQTQLKRQESYASSWQPISESKMF
jgi:hypothetical protein